MTALHQRRLHCFGRDRILPTRIASLVRRRKLVPIGSWLVRGPHAAQVQSYARQCGCLPGLLHHVSVTVVAELLTMKLQPICDLIDLLAIRMQSDANELKSLGRNCPYRSPVVSIVVSDKQTACVDGWGQPALICATQSSRKLMARRRIDQDRLPHERAVRPAGCINIRLTGEPRASSNKPSCQEASDVESLPHYEIIAYNYSDLGIEAHGQAY